MPPRFISAMRKNLSCSSGPPLSFSITGQAFGPWIWKRQTLRVTALPYGREGERSSYSKSRLYPPVSAWNLSQFAAGLRPTHTNSSSARWNRMPSPITWPAGVVGTNCLAMLTSKFATVLIPVSDTSLSASGPLKKKFTM